MKIQLVSNRYNPFIYKNIENKTSLSIISNKQDIRSDVVSFSAKNYDYDDILNPTNHCAYCGSKVYSEQQIDSLAKEMLNSKAGRLEGNIRSILEKLEDAKHSQEIATAKRLENEEEIEFFKNFMDISSKKSYLKGEEIFDQVYGYDREEATEVLVKNMRPILRTIDHISPQNENMDNRHSDINLVEACYCCNHDLKQGSSFAEFYTMFPSIKNNMPREKFNYAISDFLSSSTQTILQRLSASNLLKMLERLFIQRTETSNYIDSIDFRINNCMSEIDDAVEKCKKEINEKEIEMSGLEAEFDKLNNDAEYVALLKRTNINSQINSINDVLNSLRQRKQKISNSLNELNDSKSTKKKQETISSKEKEEKQKRLRDKLFVLKCQISEQEEQQKALQSQLEELNIEFPSIEMVQEEEFEAKSVYDAHLSMKEIKKETDAAQNSMVILTEKEDSIKAQISEISENNINFDINKYPEEQKKLFGRYNELNEALKYINEHPNIGSIKILINNMAKGQIISEIEELEKQPIVIDYNNYAKRKDLKSQLNKTTKEKANMQENIERLNKQYERYANIAKSMTEEEAVSKMTICAQTKSRLIEKQNQVKIPQKINILKSEITLLNNTIEDLKSKQAKINSSYSQSD